MTIPVAVQQGRSYSGINRGIAVRLGRHQIAEPSSLPRRLSLLTNLPGPMVFAGGLAHQGEVVAPAKVDGRPGFRIENAPADARLVPLLGLDHDMCAWPLGDDHLFCGAPVDPDAPSRQRRRYCAFHGSRATDGPALLTLKPSKEMRR